MNDLGATLLGVPAKRVVVFDVSRRGTLFFESTSFNICLGFAKLLCSL